MVRICNENMANAIRIVTVEEGIDPREFALVAFGGAGATHACEIADAINMRRVVVPPRPGLFSAFGALAAIVRVDAVRSVYLTDRTTSPASSTRSSVELEARALGRRRRAGARAAARRAPLDRDALPGPELRAGGRRAGGDGRRGRARGGVRRVRPPLRGLLRLPPRRHPDRARAALGGRDGRAARVRRPPQRGRPRARARRAATSSSPSPASSAPTSSGASASRRARRAPARSSSSRWTRPSSSRPAGRSRSQRRGILDLTRA